MFNNFSEEARKIIILAKEEMKNLHHPYVSSEHLLLAILKNKNNVSLKLKKYNLDYDSFKKEVIDIIGIGKKESEWVLYTPMFKAILEKAIIISSEAMDDVRIEHLFQALLDEGEGIAIRILINMNIDIDSLYNEFVNKKVSKNKKKKNILDDIGKELTLINNNFDPVVGRENEIKRIIEILTRRNKNNPLLIGEAGVGKTAIVEELSRLIINNDVPQKLLNKHIISLDMSSLVAGTKYRGEFEEKINKIIKEVEENEDIILFIDEIHTLVGAGGAEGAIDAANIFKPALARGKIKVIGATTLNEYKKFMESDKALDRRFQTVIVEEPKIDVVKNIINTLKPIYEDYHKVILSNEVLDKLINYSYKYIKNRKEPDRTIDILDEVCSHANLKENKELQKFNQLNKELYNTIKLKKEALLNDNIDDSYNYKIKEQNLMTEINNLEFKLSKSTRIEVTLKDLEEVLMTKIKIPSYKFSLNFNKKSYLKKLTNKIVGQEQGLRELIDTYYKNLKTDNCYGILLTGPTGTGKTLASTYFSSLIDYHVIRLDMSEYSSPSTISKLIGVPLGYNGYNEPAILESINNYPFTVLILDEIDKCHESILNLFYEALDNNVIKNNRGENIYFNNAIIIMTSNLGSNSMLGFNSKRNHKNYIDYFGKSFMNRITKVIEFNTLTLENMEKIINNLIKGKYRLTKKEKEEILNKCEYQNYGARQITCILKDYQDSKIVV